ncbi:unnamed protein product [Dimorphilus gyrociliatus]|uniref:Uncharacterized protein n=1 Tax=Dimorphilus gyrociliatus TaxID=2664684 RepID=A0A7I8W343_9ANNE|nr:unnamed protein product [Dimorphilus gyrociliatus]
MFEDQIEEKPSKKYNKKCISNKYLTGHSVKHGNISKKNRDRLFSWISDKNGFIDKDINSFIESDCIPTNNVEKQTHVAKSRLHFVKNQDDQKQYALELSLNKRNRWNTVQQTEYSESAERLDYISENNYSILLLRQTQQKLIKKNIAEGQTFYDKNGKVRKNINGKRIRSKIISESKEIKKPNNELDIDNTEIMFEVYRCKSACSRKRRHETFKLKEKVGNRVKLETYTQHFKNEVLSKADFQYSYDDDDDDEFEEYDDCEYSNEAPAKICLADFFSRPRLKEKSRNSSQASLESQNTASSRKGQTVVLNENYTYNYKNQKYDSLPPENPITANFEFSLPTSCSLSFADCDLEDIPIIESQSTPPLFLLDVSSQIRTILLARGDLSRRKNLVRALILMKYQRNEDALNVTMTFTANITTSNRLPPTKSFSVSNFKDIVYNLKQTINDWLKDAILIDILDLCNLFSTKEIKMNKNGTISDLIHEHLGMTHKIRSREDTFYQNLEEYWIENKTNVEMAHLKTTMDDNTNLVCNICFIEIDKGNSLALKCNHYFCIQCWESHLKFKFIATCPQFQCDEPVKLPVYYALFGYLLTYRVESKRVSERNMGQWLACKNFQCNLMLKMENMDKLPMCECLCSKHWCLDCDDNFHWPSACEQQKLYDQLRNPGKGSSNALGQVVVRVKSCPYCRRKFEKNGGCNSMMCHCGANFCWACAKPMKNHINCKLLEEEKFVLRDYQYFNMRMINLAETCSSTLESLRNSSENHEKLFLFYKDQFSWLNERENKRFFINLVQKVKFQCYKELFLIKNMAIFLGAFDARVKIPKDLSEKLTQSRKFLSSVYYRIKLLKNSVVGSKRHKPQLSLKNIEKFSMRSSKDMKELVKICHEIKEGNFQKYILDSLHHLNL